MKALSEVFSQKLFDITYCRVVFETFIPIFSTKMKNVLLPTTADLKNLKKAPYWLSKFFPHFGIENGVASPQYVGWSIFAIYGFAIVPQFSPHSCRHFHRIFISISDLKPNVLAGFYNFPVWCYWQCKNKIREYVVRETLVELIRWQGIWCPPSCPQPTKS